MRELLAAERRTILTINWRFFSLEQVNSTRGADWLVWQHGIGESRSLPAYQAALAARRQGDGMFSRMHLALFRARFENKLDFTDTNALMDVARSTDLNMADFQRDFQDRSLLAELGRDHLDAVRTFGIFGVPTLVLPDGAAAYIRLMPHPPVDQILPLYEEIVSGLKRPYLARNQAPRPAQSVEFQATHSGCLKHGHNT